jgi:glutamyl-tRNA synthetase
VGGPCGPYRQSERLALYAEHAERLVAAGLAYPCWCTDAELEARRQAALAAGRPPHYDGTCRRLTPEQRAERERSGLPKSVRFAVPAGDVVLHDLVRGEVKFPEGMVGDFVILRSNGLPTYNFACVVDDHEMAISHVIRGDDHISNTPRQLLLYRAFGWEPPVFAHAAMILGPDGSRLSKRHGATSVEAFAELGILPDALVNFLALLGWAYDGTREIFTREELEQLFRLDRVGANPSTFNPEKLEWINAQHLKRLPEELRARLVRDFLAARGVDVAAHSDTWWSMLVRALGDRLKTLADAAEYGRFALEPALEIEPEAWAGMVEKPGSGERLVELATRLDEDAEWSAESLERITRGTATDAGVKAGELIGFARVALTGRRISPGIFDVMLLLGKERVLARLREAASRWRAQVGAGA